MSDALSPAQWLTFQALADRIIPADDYLGAWASGAGDFLAWLFTIDGGETLLLYKSGLDCLEAEASLKSGTSFARLPPAAQDDLLCKVEAGQVKALWPIDPAHFFRTVVTHVAEGFYSDSLHGGNRDRLSWKMMGFTGANDLERP